MARGAHIVAKDNVKIGEQGARNFETARRRKVFISWSFGEGPCEDLGGGGGRGAIGG